MEQATPNGIHEYDGCGRANSRVWLGLAIIALPCMLYSMDLTVLNLAVPALSTALTPTSAELLWILDIYGFVLAGTLIPMGILGDRIGKRRLLLIGATFFSIASIFAAFSPNATALIVTRGILGVAGATLAPATLSLIRTMFENRRERMIAIGVWTSSYSVGAAIGPIAGGMLLQRFWWGSAFLVGVPVMLLLLVFGPSLLPEHRETEPKTIDVTSTGLALVAVFSTIYGIKRTAECGFDWPNTLCIAIGFTLSCVFYRRQRYISTPMIDMRLFSDPHFSVALATYALVSFVAFGSLIFVSQYLQLVLGMEPVNAGLWSLPFAMGFAVGSIAAPLIVRRLSPVILIVCGLLTAACGFVLLSCVNSHTLPATLGIVCFIYTLGLSPAFTLTTAVIVNSAPPAQVGVVSALSETCSEFGGALGIALLGSIGTATYRVELSRLARDAHLDMPNTATSLGAALQEAHQIGGSVGSILMESSRLAFVQGIHAAAAVSAAIVLVTAVLVARTLRNSETMRAKVSCQT